LSPSSAPCPKLNKKSGHGSASSPD
jgi:hypothetical protein